MDRFERELVDLFEDEVGDIKASSDFKKKVMEKNKKSDSLLSFFKKIWCYEVTLDLRVCVAAILLIVTIPTVYVFNKADELKRNEIKIYNQNSIK